MIRCSSSYIFHLCMLCSSFRDYKKKEKDRVCTLTRPPKKESSNSRRPALFVGSMTSSSPDTKKYFLADARALSSSSTIRMKTRQKIRDNFLSSVSMGSDHRK